MEKKLCRAWRRIVEEEPWDTRAKMLEEGTTALFGGGRHKTETHAENQTLQLPVW